MQPPKPFIIDGRTHWDYGPTDLVRYILWEHGRPMQFAQIHRALGERYGCKVLGPNLSSVLTRLVARREIGYPPVVKLKRGLYVHVSHADRFKFADASPSPASDLASILS